MIAPDVTQIFTTVVVWLSLALALGLLGYEFAPDLLLQRRQRLSRTRAVERLAPLRLLRLLMQRGLSGQDFVARLTPDEIDRAIATCRSCSNAARCEAVLQRYLPANDLRFCPNRDAIVRAAQPLPQT